MAYVRPKADVVIQHCHVIRDAESIDAVELFLGYSMKVMVVSER